MFSLFLKTKKKKYLHVPKAVCGVESKQSGRHCKNPNDENAVLKSNFGKKKIFSFYLPWVPHISQYQEKSDGKCGQQ
jgi:hypothetical protein